MKRDRNGNAIMLSCWNCRWHNHDNSADEWICENPASDYHTDYTEPDEKCDDWEERRL